MTLTQKEEIRKLHDEGVGLREIARRVQLSHPYVLKILRDSQAGSKTEVSIADLAQSVRSFAIERVEGQWKVVNYDLSIGVRNETGCHSDLSSAVAEALQLWAQ